VVRAPAVGARELQHPTCAHNKEVMSRCAFNFLGTATQYHRARGSSRAPSCSASLSQPPGFSAVSLVNWSKIVRARGSYTADGWAHLSLAQRHSETPQCDT
jgi:hypothetical protein